MYVDRRSLSGAKPDPAAERLERAIRFLNGALDRGRPLRLGPMPASEMSVDPAVWALYDRHFPGRTIAWDRSCQLWRIWQAGQVVDMVFYWTAEDPERHEALSEDQVAELVTTDDHAARLQLRKAFRPFTYWFVEERLRIKRLVEAEEAKGFVRKTTQRNKARGRRLMRHHAHQQAAFLADHRRWLPAIGSGHADDRIPQVPVGIALRAVS